jgi:uncharacterized protein (DUF433 family)
VIRDYDSNNNVLYVQPARLDENGTPGNIVIIVEHAEDLGTSVHVKVEIDAEDAARCLGELLGQDWFIEFVASLRKFEPEVVRNLRLRFEEGQPAAHGPGSPVGEWVAKVRRGADAARQPNGLVPERFGQSLSVLLDDLAALGEVGVLDNEVGWIRQHITNVVGSLLVTAFRVNHEDGEAGEAGDGDTSRSSLIMSDPDVRGGALHLRTLPVPMERVVTTISEGHILLDDMADLLGVTARDLQVAIREYYRWAGPEPAPGTVDIK